MLEALRQPTGDGRLLGHGVPESTGRTACREPEGAQRREDKVGPGGGRPVDGPVLEILEAAHAGEPAGRAGDGKAQGPAAEPESR